MNYNALVTGCGGDIGQSIIKILRDINLVDQVIGCDIHDEHPGVLLADDFYIVNRADDPAYLSKLRAIIIKHEVKLLIPVSEPELRLHSSRQLYSSLFGVKVICPDFNAMKVGFDKLNTAKFLEANNLPFPYTYPKNNTSNPSFPCILKSRKGSGSKSIFVVRNKAEWDEVTDSDNDLIYQEYIGDELGEFTCGLFKSGNTVRSLTFRRKLTGGYSGFGEIVNIEAVDKLLVDLANHLNLEGSINIQLRIRNNMPYIFEINPRFSSTVRFRHLFGFKDVLWSIEAKLGTSISDYFAPIAGRKFYKGYAEFISD